MNKMPPNLQDVKISLCGIRGVLQLLQFGPGSAVAAMNRSAPAQIITALGKWEPEPGVPDCPSLPLLSPENPSEIRAVSHRENISLHTAPVECWAQLVPIRRGAEHSPHCCGQDDAGVVAEVANGCLSQQQISEDVAPEAVEHSTEPGGKRALPGHLHGSCEKS